MPCGVKQGRTSEVIIAGGHHDTVYHAQGAIDDTSGTVTVMEMARQMSLIYEQSGIPERTVSNSVRGAVKKRDSGAVEHMLKKCRAVYEKIYDVS